MKTKDISQDFKVFLPEDQEACPYCRGLVDLNNTENSDFQVNIDMYDESDPTLWVYFDGGQDNCNVSISYCPKCGRKLVAE